jgi:hypothetical protein
LDRKWKSGRAEEGRFQPELFPKMKTGHFHIIIPNEVEFALVVSARSPSHKHANGGAAAAENVPILHDRTSIFDPKERIKPSLL